jgi:hypothetical protein
MLREEVKIQKSEFRAKKQLSVYPGLPERESRELGIDNWELVIDNW